MYLEINKTLINGRGHLNSCWNLIGNVMVLRGGGAFSRRLGHKGLTLTEELMQSHRSEFSHCQWTGFVTARVRYYKTISPLCFASFVQANLPLCFSVMLWSSIWPSPEAKQMPVAWLLGLLNSQNHMPDNPLFFINYTVLDILL